MRIVRQSTYLASPWKNGGGITHEAMRVPAAGAAFRWRVSIAQIDASGPFSDFAGYERKMVLLRGAGLRLVPDDDVPIVLRSVGDLAEFDGGRAMQCELLDGTCTDLNLMVSRSIPHVRAWVDTAVTLPDLTAMGATTILVLPISGTLAIGHDDAEAVDLNPWDLAVLTRDERIVIRTASNNPAPLVFFATLDDDSR